MNKAALEKLASLAEARKSRDLAAIEALTAEQRRLEGEIAELAGTEARDAADGPVSFALVARRAAWAASQIALRERRIAAIAIELAGVRAAARVSVGKHRALERLLLDAEAGKRSARERSEEIDALTVASRGVAT